MGSQQLSLTEPADSTQPNGSWRTKLWSRLSVPRWQSSHRRDALASCLGDRIADLAATGLTVQPSGGNPRALMSRMMSAAVVQKRRSVVREVTGLEIGLFAVGMTLLVVLNAVAPRLRAALELLLAGSLATFSVASLAIAVAAVPSVRLPSLRLAARRSRSLPNTTAIIAAYLPNEAEVLADSIQAHLDSGPENLQVIVAYNTPNPMEFEQDLMLIAERDPRVVILHVPASTSKAENINAALAVATGEIIGLFDADHHPHPGGFERASRWLDAGFDVVQGRCVVRPGSGSSLRQAALTTIVGTEFETMYAVGHPGRTRLHGFGLFGGSNGYWRSNDLRHTLFDSSALTEDIDASVRLLARGGRIATDPAIISSELAPPSWTALMNQRLRWAQGWLQVSQRHLRNLAGTKKLTWRQRAGTVWLFGFGVIVPWLAALTLPFMIFNLTVGPSSQWRPWIGAFVTIGTVAFLAHTTVAYHHSAPADRKLLKFVLYVVANIVVYAQLRVAIVRLGHLHHLLGRTEWRVTPRALPCQLSSDLAQLSGRADPPAASWE